MVINNKPDLESISGISTISSAAVNLTGNLGFVWPPVGCFGPVCFAIFPPFPPFFIFSSFGAFAD